MRGKNRNSIEEREKLPQFTTMHVIDGQADIVKYASLNFYSLTINNILNIIVMLILVAVTINVALNGGIFDKATKAKEDTQKETDKEQLLASIVATVDNNGNFNLENLELPEGFTYDDTTGIYTGPTGKKYTVNTTTGKVEEVTNSNPGNSGNSGNTEPQEGTYVITVADIVTQGIFNENVYFFINPYTKLINILNSEDLKNIMTQVEEPSLEGDYYYFNNIVCSDDSLNNLSNGTVDDLRESDDNFYHIDYCEVMVEEVTYKYLTIFIKKDGVHLTDENYTSDAFKDLTFTITAE